MVKFMKIYDHLLPFIQPDLWPFTTCFNQYSSRENKSILISETLLWSLKIFTELRYTGEMSYTKFMTLHACFSQPSRSKSAASQSTDGTYLRFSENSLIPSLPLSSQCTKSEITYYLHCINGFPNSHVMKKLLWKTASYQAIIETPTLHGRVSQIYYYNETSFIGHPQ